MKRTASAFALLLAALLVCPAATLAATSGSANVTLQTWAVASIEVLDPAITLLPTATDYDNDYVEAAGASGLRVRVHTNANTGLQLLLSCQDAAPEIALNDLLVRTQTPPQGSGTSISTYTPISSSDQMLWSSSSQISSWLTVTTDIRIQNLLAYADDVAAGYTDYTNTLTYQVVTQ